MTGKPDAPHHHGHRARLRERFLTAGDEALADYELMELCLFRAIPRRDVKPLAKTLIERFGGFAEALGAPVERLTEVEGISQAVAVDLKVIAAAARRAARARVMNQP
ncbi:MAG: hypothetical protein MI723_17935, partial [Caulobacterales bacterium]|nr:hypothetical protein [Caulobacterales bacterium]